MRFPIRIGSALAVVGASVFASTIPSTAHASVDVALSLEQLAGSSDVVAVFRPLERLARWEGGRIWTYTRVRAERTIAGDAPIGTELWVKTRGGVVGRVGQWASGEPTLGVGKPSLLFVRTIAADTAEIVGRAQGQYGLIGDDLEGARLDPGQTDKLVSACAARRISSSECARPAAGTELAGRTLEQAEARINAAWRGSHEDR